jgi:hypothetical protein
MQTDTITIPLGQFASGSVNPADLAKQIIAARKANIRVLFQLDQPEALGVLEVISAAVEKHEARRLAMPGVIGVALTASLGTMLVGFIMLF